MGKTVFKDPYFELDSTDLSDHVESVTINHEADTPEATASGDDTHTMLPNGLKNVTIDVTFRQDFDASSVEEKLWNNFNTSTTVKVRPSQAAKAATNPEYSLNGIVKTNNPVDGSVGDVHNTSTQIVPDATAGNPDLQRST